jgi:hypothetical protein
MASLPVTRLSVRIPFPVPLVARQPPSSLSADKSENYGIFLTTAIFSTAESLNVNE